MKRFFSTLFCALFLSWPAFSVERERSIWAFPENYEALLHDARKGNKHAQNEIAEIIYKGIMRYPVHSKKRDEHFFGWLKEVDKGDSFSKRVARLFFMNGESPDFQRTYDEIKTKAQQGDPFAQRAMGSLYFYTDLVENDPKAGMEWYTKAADQGNARAQMSLALRYIDGTHAEKNIEKAIQLLRTASDAGLPEAQSTLSVYYFEGHYVQKDIQKALHLLKSAANSGDTKSQIELALLYFGIESEGWPISQDKKAGEYWLDKAYKYGDTDAMFLYGSLSVLGGYFQQDIAAGLLMWKAAAELGNEDALKSYKKAVES